MSRALWDSGYTYTVEAAFDASTGTYGVWDTSLWDSATWGPAVVWNDITADVVAWASNIGRDRENDHYASGNGSVTVDNVSADYTPENTSSPFATGGVAGVRPGRPIRGYITAPSGTSYPLFRGTIDDFDEDVNSLLPQMVFPWVDGISDLSAVDGYEQSPAGAGETVGYRMHRLLDAAEWTDERNIDLGTTTMQATTLAQNAWTEIQLTADSDGGEVWVDPDGTLVFQDHEAPLRNTRSNTSQYTFTDADTPGAYHFETVTLANGMDIIVNEAALARAGGTVRTATDLTSRALYRLRRWGRNDLICDDDGLVAQLAEQLVARRADPTRRPRQIVLNPTVYSNLWPVICDLRMRDRIKVTVHHKPADIEISYDCFVDGIKHNVNDTEWITTVQLASTAGIVPAADFGVWDTSTWDNCYWGVEVA